MIVVVSIPHPCLSPNARPHWAQKAKAKATARAEAALMARQAIGRRKAPRWELADVRVTWYAATRRVQDGDNALARLKATMDGMADAGVVGNDRGFIYHPIRFECDPKTPRVQIEVTEHRSSK